MIPVTRWHEIIALESHLPPEASRRLRDVGFVVMPGPALPGGCEQLSAAYDRAVAQADVADIHHGRTGTSTRVDDFVNRGPEFDGLYLYPPVLAACCEIIGGPFKLSGMRARTLNAGAPMERLHIDVKHGADGWPLVGCILMVDAFEEANGATRFVPASHLQTRDLADAVSNPCDAHPDQVVAWGPAGSIIIFNASAWHGHGANRSAKPRRSIQAHFVPRTARLSPDAPSFRMRTETLQRIGDLAKYILDI